MGSVSEPGYFCTNGMSESRHDSPFANSGLVVTVTPEDTGSRHPLAGVHFQQRAERLAYLSPRGRDYSAPIQRARRLPRPAGPSRGKTPEQLPPRGTKPADLGMILPPGGHGSPRTRPPGDGPAVPRPVPPRRHDHRARVARESSPVRIPRDDATRQHPAVSGLYPCGEGAGYAGGIISAAVDGLRTARALVAHHARPGGG